MTRLERLIEASWAPDSSGRRGGNPLLRSPRSRSDDYPYDGPDVGYGQPGPYDRGSSGAGAFHGQITPKDTDHSVWDDVEEALGVPFNLTISSRGNNGSGVPGMSQGWAVDPPKPWDEDLDEATYFTTEPLPIENPPPASVPNFHDMTDDDVEKKLDRIWGRDDNRHLATDPEPELGSKPVDLDLVVFKVLGDVVPQESAWGELVRKILSPDISSPEG